MEQWIYSSANRQKIIDIKKFLEDSGIPVLKITLNIEVRLDKRGRHYSFVEELKESNELTVPIEEFDDELNDAQYFAMYINSEDYDNAVSLLEAYFNEASSENCVFLSDDYEETVRIKESLLQQGIGSKEIIEHINNDGSREYVLYTEPEDVEAAQDFIEEHYPYEKQIKEPEPERKRAKGKYGKEVVSIYSIIITILVILVVFIILRSI